jgi:hypothetical protein
MFAQRERMHMTESQSATNRGAGGGILGAVKERASEQLSNQKGRATDGLDAIANAVRRTTEELREDQHDTLAHYVDRAAAQLEQWATTIRNKDLDELLTETKRLARRQPALFIGGSFVAGLLVARFLKSSSDESRDYPGAGQTIPFQQQPGLDMPPYPESGRL